MNENSLLKDNLWKILWITNDLTNQFGIWLIQKDNGFTIPGRDIIYNRGSLLQKFWLKALPITYGTLKFSLSQ